MSCAASARSWSCWPLVDLSSRSRVASSGHCSSCQRYRSFQAVYCYTSFVCSYCSHSRILRLVLCRRQGGVALFSLVFFCTLKCLVHVNNSTVILPSGQEMHLISLLRRARRSDHNEEQVAPSSLCPTCALSRATLAAINRDEDQRARINVLVVIPQGEVNHE